MSLLTCENVVLGYEGEAVVKNLSFTVEEGDYLCVLGENGSGKSTLMKALTGLKEPLSGKIQYGGGLRRADVGYLPQQTQIQKDFPASVREIVRSGCLGRMELRPFYGRKEKQAAEDNMARLKISDLAGRCYRELSGGQQQRVLLARALCASTRLLLLDEPVAGLDPLITGEMYQLVKDLNEKDGITILMISHDMEAVEYASHILHIGREPLFFGKREEYIRHGNNLFGSRKEVRV